jgi:hypothetical protein
MCMCVCVQLLSLSVRVLRRCCGELSRFVTCNLMRALTVAIFLCRSYRYLYEEMTPHPLTTTLNKIGKKKNKFRSGQLMESRRWFGWSAGKSLAKDHRGRSPVPTIFILSNDNDDENNKYVNSTAAVYFSASFRPDIIKCLRSCIRHAFVMLEVVLPADRLLKLHFISMLSSIKLQQSFFVILFLLFLTLLTSNSIEINYWMHTVTE